MVTAGFFWIHSSWQGHLCHVGIIPHFIDPSKPKESEHCAEETSYQELPD